MASPIKLTESIKKKIYLAVLAAGVSAPSAYIATELTTPAEGFYLVPYVDPVGLTTICIGHLVKKGEVVKKQYTIDECLAIFAKDWKEHEALLDKVVKVPYKSEWMKAALTDFTFNKGIGNVSSSTLLRLLNDKRYEAACEQLSRWVYGKVNGVSKVLPGLVFRATKQYDACMGNIPSDYKSKMEQWNK